MGNIEQVLFVNSFLEVDGILEDTLKKSLEILKTTPEGMDELSYHYYSVLVNSQPLTSEQISYKSKVNPIKVPGRICIINSCLNSQPVGDRFEKLPISALIVHTLKNCLINIIQSDKLAKMSPEEEYVAEKQSALASKLQTTQPTRKTKYINGGHSLLEVSSTPQLSPPTTSVAPLSPHLARALHSRINLSHT